MEALGVLTRGKGNVPSSRRENVLVQYVHLRCNLLYLFIDDGLLTTNHCIRKLQRGLGLEDRPNNPRGR